MNGKLVIAFIVGFGLGTFLTKRHYDKMFQDCACQTEEVDELEETIEESAVEDVLPQAPWRIDKPDLLEYAAKIRESKYTIEPLNEPDISEEGGVEPMDSERPYVISPDEFGEDEEFETETLFYHADGVLTDSRLNVIENIDEIVGIDPSDHFGEYEDDSVFVRNEALHVEYEILRDIRNFADIEASPHMDDD